MAWTDDPYWAAASREALAALDEADLVLVPHEFLDLHERFAPLEFSFGLSHTQHKVAYCCTKDDVDRLAPVILSDLPARYRWANEVFVLGAGFDWRRSSRPALRQHLRFWQLRLDRRARGERSREPNWRISPGGDSLSGAPKVLIIGASGMGNIGDDLLGQAVAALVRDASGGRLEPYLAGPDIDALDLTRFAAVVVGGGGLIYASRDGSKEWQNLANYLKFGPLCATAGLPVAMIGVSDQDHAHAIEASPLVTEFAQTCLPCFLPVTTRDADSAALLLRLHARTVITGSDLLFACHAAVAKAPRPERAAEPRLALAGELYAAPVFERALADAPAFDPLVQGRTFDYLLMSDDDVAHAQRARERIRRAGGTVDIVDLRGATLESVTQSFLGWRGLITTRFHGLVMAAMAGLPVLAIDGAEGKKARLLRELGASPEHLLHSDDVSASGMGRLYAAWRGELKALDALAVSRHARHADVHRGAVVDLLRQLPPAAAAVRQPATPPVALAPMIPPRRDAEDEAALQARLTAGGEVGLCWAASSSDTDGYANLGDALSAVVVSALSGMPVKHVHFNRSRSKLVAVGSIGHAISGGEAVMWGTGVSIRGGVLMRNVPRTRYDMRAMRGAISADHFRNLGVSVPAIYGDPVWLLPSIYHEPVEPIWELGVIPHIQDIDGFGPDARSPADSLRYIVDASDAASVTIINTWHPPTWEGMKQTLRRIRSCKRIVSQSFHGVVIAEAYGIPVLNFRQVGGRDNGLLQLNLKRPCVTDPRIHEFYDGGRARRFPMYAQRREERSDWPAVMAAVDRAWTPFDYDPRPLIDAFPLPLAYDPTLEQVRDHRHIEALRF